MRRLILALFILPFLLAPELVYSQLSYEGIDVISTKPTGDEWRHYEDEGMATRDGVGYFDSVDFHLVNDGEEQVYAFMKDNGTGMVYNRVYRDLVNRFGKESSRDDYIPDRASDDWDYIAILIDQEKAEVNRTWYPKNVEQRVMVKLVWKKSLGLAVLFYRNLK